MQLKLTLTDDYPSYRAILTLHTEDSSLPKVYFLTEHKLREFLKGAKTIAEELDP